MKTIVLYYSLSGKTKAEAEKIAAEKDAEIYEVEELKKRGIFNAFYNGCPSSMKRKASAIKTLQCKLDEYDKIMIGAPVWGGFPAPAFNAMLNLLPAGKEVELFICSAGGETPKSEQGTKELIQSKGCTLISYRNIKTGK